MSVIGETAGALKGSGGPRWAIKAKGWKSVFTRIVLAERPFLWPHRSPKASRSAPEWRWRGRSRRAWPSTRWAIRLRERRSELDLMTFSEAEGERKVEMAIEMSSVALRICWESVIERNPGLSREELLRAFKRRVGTRHAWTEDEGR